MAQREDTRVWDVQVIRDAYMQKFSELFEDELLEVYYADGGADTVKTLTACIESGTAVWSNPLHIEDPEKA